jgi:outer membrane receptor protein involved in Fe transport
VELDVEARLGGGFRVQGGYALTDGVVASFPPSPDIEGNLLPQLPRHQGSLRVGYETRRLSLGASVRYVGAQFEDDLNQLRLSEFAVIDVTAGYRVGRSAEVFVAAENLLDERYAVGLTPTATIGPPLLAHAGVRLRFGGDGRP